MFTHESKSAHGLQFQVLLTLKDFSRSQAYKMSTDIRVSRSLRNIMYITSTLWCILLLFYRVYEQFLCN